MKRVDEKGSTSYRFGKSGAEVICVLIIGILPDYKNKKLLPVMYKVLPISVVLNFSNSSWETLVGKNDFVYGASQGIILLLLLLGGK
jgi:hypothetical protein